MVKTTVTIRVENGIASIDSVCIDNGNENGSYKKMEDVLAKHLDRVINDLQENALSILVKSIRIKNGTD
jgi:hypothetical protein